MPNKKNPSGINYLVLFFFLLTVSAEAQNFTWMKGNNSFNQPPNYGSMGIASPFNTPGARLSAASWKDSNGNFWLFGGSIPTGGLNMLLANDLWKYDVGTNQWTWMHGSTMVSQYGTSAGQGIADPNNAPGSRNNAITWTDASGNLWLYGGVGFSLSSGGDLGDLWKYEIATNMWTYISGGSGVSQNSVFGTLGVAASTNKLGSRRGAVSWTDPSGNMWLFGGLGFDVVGYYGFVNELWRYTPSANQWTWMGGSSTGQQNGKYGVLGVPSSTNMPGGRGTCAWSSDAFGNLLLFGGNGYDASSLTGGALNDLWKYNMSTNQWTWLGGSTTKNQTGIYGTQGVPSSANMPGSRTSSSMWTDASGRFYIFGGNGYSSVPGNELNDLWEYNSTTNQWTWVKGSNLNGQAGTYGTQGVLAPGNIPGARSLAASWQDNSGNLWLMGGYTPTVNAVAIYSDLWKLSFCTSIPPVITASTAHTAICAGQAVTLNASGATYYSWNSLPSGTISSVVVAPASTGTFAVSGMDLNGCSSTSQVVQIVNSRPTLTLTGPSDLFCMGETTTLNVTGATSFTWSGGTPGSQLIVSPLSTTNYTVTGVNANGCSNSAAITLSVNACTGIDNLSKGILESRIYPNPCNERFTIELENETPAEVSILDLKGVIILKLTINTKSHVIDLGKMINGIYLIEIQQNGQVSRNKMIKM